MVVIKLESSWWPSSRSFVWRRPFKVISRKTFLFLSLSSCYYNLSDVCAFMGCGLFKIVEAFFSGGSLYKNSKTQIASVRPFCYLLFSFFGCAARIRNGYYTKCYFTKLQTVPTFDQITLETCLICLLHTSFL